MKGGLAAMMYAVKDLAEQDAVRLRFICVPDEESEEIDDRSTDVLVREGFTGDFAITGEPTNLHIGVQAKGVLAMRLAIRARPPTARRRGWATTRCSRRWTCSGRSRTLPFTRESSELFDRPSINLGKIHGGDAVNKVPDRCEMVVDIRYLPGQDPGEILADVRRSPTSRSCARSRACPRSSRARTRTCAPWRPRWGRTRGRR